jgi:hypothetical protein
MYTLKTRRADPSKVKSELCKNYSMRGCCPYGPRCRFAHGLQELKQRNSGNCKYKTQKCRAFFRDGFCSFGARCNFQHREAQPAPRAPDSSLWPELAVYRLPRATCSRFSQHFQ